jgi:hypothetical protein
MPIIPYRELATKGILTDPSPYELDGQSWSGGSNVRFDSQKAMRAPCWRSVYPGLAKVPAFAFGYTPSSSIDQIMVVASDGTLSAYANGAVVDVSPTGYTPLGSVDTAYTSTELGDVVYINNPAMAAPLYYGPTSGQFAPLPGWGSGWSCRSLRAFGDYLMAFNVTQGDSANPNMVMWSDLTLYGAPPADWSYDDQSSLSGQNPIEGLISPLVDGCVLGDAMIAYSADEVWAIVQTGTQEIFAFQQIFSEGGLIAPNCVVEVNGQHYVFGIDDIYTHNGSTKSSIATQRVRQFVYRNLNLKLTEKCFVHHMPALTEIMFGFVSQDAEAYFQNPQNGCNRAVVYNYTNDTWSILDLPGIVAMLRSDVILQLIFSAASQTFGQIGGSFGDLAQGFQRSDVAVNQAVVPGVNGNQILAYDFVNKGQLTYPPDLTCNAPAYLTKTGIDLDTEGSDLTTYKTVKRIYPQVNTFASIPVQIDVASQMTPNFPLSYTPTVSFDPTQQYKVDLRQGGRYIGITFTVNNLADFEVAGFDFDVFSAGRR